MLWLATIQQAQKGDQESKEILEQENELRKEKGQMTVEEELKKMAEKK